MGTSPLKIFDLAKRQGRFVYTSAPMVRYSKASPGYPLKDEMADELHSLLSDRQFTPMVPTYAGHL